MSENKETPKSGVSKHTDTFFRLPVRIYDAYAARRARQQEEDTDTRIDLEYRVGSLFLPYGQLDGFHDHYFPGEEDTEEEGNALFDSTYIMTRTMGDYVCTWPKFKFIEKYNAYMEKMATFFAEQEREQKVRIDFVDGSDDEEDLNL